LPVSAFISIEKGVRQRASLPVRAFTTFYESPDGEQGESGIPFSIDIEAVSKGY
jgi:hypothetical protein